MHKYLKSIGFASVNQKSQLQQLLKDVETNYDSKIVVEHDHRIMAQLSRSYASDCGISVFGEYDEQDRFVPEYYFPYFEGGQISSHEDLAIDRHAEKNSYAGACDDYRVGVMLIFYLQNVAEYMKLEQKEMLRDIGSSVSLSGLSDHGKILLPISRDRNHERIRERKNQKRNSLLAAARKGDEDAMESLTMEDIDTYTMISSRIRTEDLYTIVESFLMPHGMECDQYNMLGEITAWHKTINSLTGETIYQMSVSTNDLPIDICINEKDLLGTPAVGCRFKGTFWLQGLLSV